ncbi:IS66 family insertion sequence element accessory protein TnpA [Sorangium atrum]|uniref:Transposase n=1 Tax=Sorangium atrum TaxID=2995308 RepID=A0ABT5C556_9BACT|nr:hypothetical protein [Sorangium aterium]MDC0681556.1 hypothetical protein [Sorangium aterium]
MDESRRIWRERVARWHKSGQSARVFAEQEGVSAGTLYSWSRRLGMKRSEYRRRSEKATLPACYRAGCLMAGRSGSVMAIVDPDLRSPRLQRGEAPG